MSRLLGAALLAVVLLSAKSLEAKSIRVSSCAEKLPIEGWTEDSRSFVFRDCDDGTGMEDRGATIWDAASGRTSSVDERGFTAFKKGHALVAKASRTSPDGSAKADVHLIHLGGGKWDDNQWNPDSVASAELIVLRGDKQTVSVPWSSGLVELQVYWSPDGRRIAWVGQPSPPWAGGDSISRSTYELAIGPGSGPRIQLLAPKPIMKDAIPKALKSIEAAGFAPIFSGRALKPRDKSVVYAASGFEDDARKLAAAVPGGASVEKLTWDAGAEVVVALGSSSVKGGK